MLARVEAIPPSLDQGKAADDIDLRVGDHWTITRTEGLWDWAVYTMTGEYLEIEVPDRLRYTIAMPQFSPNRDTISIEIAPAGSGVWYTFVQSGEDISQSTRQKTALRYRPSGTWAING